MLYTLKNHANRPVAKEGKDKVVPRASADQGCLLLPCVSKLQYIVLCCSAKIAPPTVEVRFKDLTVEAMIYLGNRSVPSVLNSYRNAFEVSMPNLFSFHAPV